MVRPGHIGLCPDTCSIRHDSTLLALFNCADNKHFDDCGLLKTALYSKLKQGWNPHTAVDDPNPEFRYPLIHWASALGKAEALQWLIKMRLKPSMQCRQTGECPLHYAVKMLYHVRRIERMSVDRICHRFNLILKALTDHDPNVLFLGDLKGNSAFHTCALSIVRQNGVSAELEYYEICLRNLMDCVQRIWNAKVWNNAADTVNTQSFVVTALNSQNDEGNTILHILARNEVSHKSLKYIIEEFSEEINKQIRNSDGMTPAEVAVSCGASLNASELGMHPENSIENLYKKLPSVFQLYTQDVNEADSQDIEGSQLDSTMPNADVQSTCNGAQHDSLKLLLKRQVSEGVNNMECGMGCKGPSLRVTSYIPRPGFYSSSTLQDQDLSSGSEGVNNMECGMGCKGPSLRVTSYIPRPGFYSSSTLQDQDLSSGSEGVNGEDSGLESPSSPSLLSNMTNSIPAAKSSICVTKSTDKAKVLHCDLTKRQDSHVATDVNGAVSSAFVDVLGCCDSSLDESDITEDDAPPAQSTGETPNAPSNSSTCETPSPSSHSKCEIEISTEVSLPYRHFVSPRLNSNPLSAVPVSGCGVTLTARDTTYLDAEGSQVSPSMPGPCVTATATVTDTHQQLDIKPSYDRPAVQAHDMGGTSVTGYSSATQSTSLVTQSSAPQGDVITSTTESAFSSPLVKFIKEEFDVASLVRAKLLDRKEKSRSELCEIQQHFQEQQQREVEESDRLRQMQLELDTLRASRQSHEERKKALTEELRMIEEASVAMETRSAELQRLIAEHNQRTQSLHKDREDLSRQCDSIKRKVEEYENALQEISESQDNTKRPKREQLDD